MNYKKYNMTKQESLKYGAFYILTGLGISALFYRSFLGVILFLPFAGVFFREMKKILAEKQKRWLEKGFLTGMRCVSTALTAGYSIENAFFQAYEELQKMYGEKEPVLLEFRGITGGLRLNQTMENLLTDLAERSGVEDIEIFAEVFETARRTGGDLISIIRSTTASISQKQETRQEIEICLSAKKMEQNIMSVIPCALIAYIGIASPEFLDSLYKNLPGILIMSICLGIYAFAFLMGLARLLYGKYGEKIDLKRFMTYSSILCVISYLCISFVPNPLLSLLGCAICGFSVGIMWPGTFSIASASIRGGGTAMFALLALAGDLGCSGGPTLAGFVSSNLGNNLRMGIFAAIVFPILLLAGIQICKKSRQDT